MPKNHNLALMGSLLVAASSLLCLLFFRAGFSLDLLSWLYVALYAIHLYMAIRVFNCNIFVIFRYTLLWSLGAIAAITRAIWQGKVYLGPFGVEHQTDDNLVIILTAGILGVCGVMIGWTRSLPSKYCPMFYSSTLIFTKQQQRLLLFIGYTLSLGAGLVYLWASGGIVGEHKPYGSEFGQRLPFEFNVFNIFHFIGIALILLVANSEERFSKQALFIAMISLVFGILAGSRADYLPQLLLLGLFLLNKKINSIIEFNKISPLKFLLYVTFGASFFYFLATFVAYLRQGSPIIEFIHHALTTRGNLINEFYGHPVLFFETGNMMIGGFYAAIVNSREGGFLFGDSYIDYILRAPPAFFGLDRPPGLDTLTVVGNEIMSQGGIFELAEAYWNFGLIGCFFIPLIIGFILGKLLKLAIFKNSLFFFICYLVPGFMAFRAIWYQNFSYFRQFTVLLLIFFIMYFFARWAMGKNRGS